jgi:hypothetical protein
MNSFVQQLGGRIQGTLSGFDRLVFRGTLRQLAYPLGMRCYLSANHVLLKNFAAHAEQTSAALPMPRCRLGCKRVGRSATFLPATRCQRRTAIRSVPRDAK